MRKFPSVYMPVVLVCWLAVLAPARAQSQLPPDRSVIFNIHTDANNPDSPVLITTEIRIKAVERNGNVVAWNPLWVAITQYDEQESIVGSWTHLNPVIPVDRYWYITHGDPTKPNAAEFANPPELTGTADNDTANGPTMDYYLLGKNTGSPPNTPYPVTSIVDYSFQRSDEPEPVVDDDDTPAETPPHDDQG